MLWYLFFSQPLNICFLLLLCVTAKQIRYINIESVILWADCKYLVLWWRLNKQILRFCLLASLCACNHQHSTIAICMKTFEEDKFTQLLAQQKSWLHQQLLDKSNICWLARCWCIAHLIVLLACHLAGYCWLEESKLCLISGINTRSFQDV